MSLFSARLRLKVSIIIWLILLIFWSIATPRLFNSYFYYRESQQSYQRLQLLHQLADLCTFISRERGPANVAMADFSEHPERSKRELLQFRQQVDQFINQTIIQFEKEQYADLQQQLNQQLLTHLSFARTRVDGVVETEAQQKTPQAMNTAIADMFDTWGQSHNILRQFLYRYQGYDKEAIDLFNLTLLITELRDQAGRLGSNIIVPLSFGEQFSVVNAERTLNNQRNIRFLWSMVGAIDGKFEHDQSYIRLEKNLNQYYMGQGLSYIDQLLKQHQRQPDDLLDSRLFTENYVEQMAHVVALQDYVAQYSKKHIEKNKKIALRNFTLTLLLLILANLTIFLMLYILNHKIFRPLLLVRERLLAMLGKDIPLDSPNEVRSLFEAVERVQQMLNKRDELEQHLTLVADTDALTHLYNRTALNKKIAYLEQHYSHLYNYALIMIDIDYFKKINDQYGHTAGDQAIINIAEQIKHLIRTEDFAVRYGGDELLILVEFVQYTAVINIAERLRAQVAMHPMLIDHHQIQLSLSVGVALGAANWIELFHQADLALLRAKQTGKNRVQVYVAEDYNDL